MVLTLTLPSPLLSPLLFFFVLPFSSLLLILSSLFLLTFLPLISAFYYFSFSVFHSTDQPGSVDPGQPLVNAIRSDSALIGGNVIHLSRSKNNSLKYLNSWLRFNWEDAAGNQQSDTVKRMLDVIDGKDTILSFWAGCPWGKNNFDLGGGREEK